MIDNIKLNEMIAAEMGIIELLLNHTSTLTDEWCILGAMSDG